MQVKRVDQVQQSQDVYTSTNQADLAAESAIFFQYRDITEIDHIWTTHRKYSASVE